MNQTRILQTHLRDKSWQFALGAEFSKPYFSKIEHYLKARLEEGAVIYPAPENIFAAFNLTPFEQAKVVILGQDPYHGPGQAMGLSFSVPRHLAKPASLRNVYKELLDDVGAPIASHGDLTSWSKQGVFLLNAMLTVEHKKAGSHQKIGWQEFTDAVIGKLSEQREGLIFMLWGNFAKRKKVLIDESKHHVLESAHPSPLAGPAFLGNKHFSTANKILTEQGKEPINWDLN